MIKRLCNFRIVCKQHLFFVETIVPRKWFDHMLDIGKKEVSGKVVFLFVIKRIYLLTQSGEKLVRYIERFVGFELYQ